INMVRVWGGGQYEQECFYDLCDEKGLLVWQDLMFACCLYPAGPDFLDSVGMELEYQIPRLRKHASLALWCGDNEVSGAVRWRSNGKTDLLVRNHIQYDRLNRTLAEKVGKLDPDRVFWPSSPSAGPDAVGDGWHDDTQGDMHYWEVWHGGRGFDAYRTVKPRFCSEFGFESFPSLETVDSFCPPEQKNLFSPVMDLHQKCASGSAPILTMFGSLFRMPSGFEKTLYLSQVQQAEAIRAGVEFWRSLKPRCMGTLFWQLNDDWPTVSWSAVEYSGKWKMLMYQARRFYAPVLLAATAETGTRTVLAAVSDLLTDVTLELVIEYRTFEGAVLKSERRVADLPAGSCLNLGTLEIPEEKADDPEEVFCEIYSAPDPAVNNGEPLRCTHFFVPAKKCELRDPELRTTVTSDERGNWEVRLRAKKPAFHVALDAPGVPGRFSDNDFSVMPQETRVIRFFPDSPCTAKALRERLSTMDLYESYH
ncbi:MAG: glycoside hydrolase family 2 protein, partial [Lentisphaeria bacterium]|nr:glycoside hydrolase family 2 protein [Lentisphaeria bacterium]